MPVIWSMIQSTCFYITLSSPKNPFILYWSHERFNLDMMTDKECRNLLKYWTLQAWLFAITTSTWTQLRHSIYFSGGLPARAGKWNWYHDSRYLSLNFEWFRILWWIPFALTWYICCWIGSAVDKSPTFVDIHRNYQRERSGWCTTALRKYIQWNLSPLLHPTALLLPSMAR